MTTKTTDSVSRSTWPISGANPAICSTLSSTIKQRSRRRSAAMWTRSGLESPSEASWSTNVERPRSASPTGERSTNQAPSGNWRVSKRASSWQPGLSYTTGPGQGEQALTALDGFTKELEVMVPPDERGGIGPEVGLDGQVRSGQGTGAVPDRSIGANVFWRVARCTGVSESASASRRKVSGYGAFRAPRSSAPTAFGESPAISARASCDNPAASR